MTENQKLREALSELIEAYNRAGPELSRAERAVDCMRLIAAHEALALPTDDVKSVLQDAQRYRWLREQSDDDFAFAVVKNPHFDVYESPEELDAAIDAAMRKGQL